MAGDASATTRTGWVYRSETEPARSAPVDPSPAVPSHVPAARVEARADPMPQRPARGWIESGLYVMTLPITIAAAILLAPVAWMFGARPRQ